MNGSDPTGHIFETPWDVLNVVYDLGKIGVGWYSEDDELLAEGIVDLGVDVGSTLVPGLPGGTSKAARTATRTVANGGKFSKQTERALIAVGRARPGQPLHHVGLLRGGGRSGDLIRDKLAGAGIKLNDLENGAGLTYHIGSHPERYADAVWDRLKGLDGEDAIRVELGKIGDELLSIDRGISSGTIKAPASTRAGPSTINEWLKRVLSGGASK
ncbi:MAG: AHH domain-containing protein [Paracoccaceae bacterium]